MKHYHGLLKKEMSSYIEIQKLSGKYTSHIECTLASLDEFLISSGKDHKEIYEKDITNWLKTITCAPATKKKKFSALKGFAKYLHACRIQCTLPEAPKQTATTYTPYLYSKDEWSRIITESDNILLDIRHSTSNTPIVFPVLVRLLYSSGLRLNEALSLRICDVNFDDGILTIYKAKRNRQRLIPLKASMLEVLIAYCNRMGIRQCSESFIFINRYHNSYSDSWAERWFKIILDRAGVTYHKKNRYERGPCLHCLRHTFVFQSFIQAETIGYSLDDSVPILSTYLGHENIMETDRYLKFSYELYPEAHDFISNYTKDVFPEVE